MDGGGIGGGDVGGGTVMAMVVCLVWMPMLVGGAGGRGEGWCCWCW